MATKMVSNLTFCKFLCFLLIPGVMLIILIYNNYLAQTHGVVAITI
jgi:hypothetical protein